MAVFCDSAAAGEEISARTQQERDDHRAHGRFTLACLLHRGRTPKSRRDSRELGLHPFANPVEAPDPCGSGSRLKSKSSVDSTAA